MLAVMHKQPADHLDYDVDYSRWLPDDDTITTVETEVSPLDPEAGVTVTSVNVASPVVKVWLEGGVAGVTYTITVKASTQGGRIKESEFQIRLKEC